LRPSTVKIDPDFYGERKNEERERALYAKFSQNEELKSLIILTRSATLKHYIPKQKAEKDFILMKVRSKIQREN
jgi:3'-phosphoadenosine 5'-phosphosulfate sulfotransferase (PAPS reductase)/FAD synthetase